MSVRSLVVVRKTVRDFSNPALLVAFLVPFLAVGSFLAMGLTDDLPEDLATSPLHVQEQALTQVLAPLTYVWALGLPVMALTAVLAANAVAKETQTGTLHILLSKPIRRWEVLLGKFVSVFLYSFLAMVAGLLLVACGIYVFSGASAAALAGSVGALAAGNLAYALFVAFVVGAVGTFAATLTGTRVRTVLVTLVVPVLFFAFMFVRLLPSSDIYEDYYLYVVDVGYHFGNAFVFLHEVAGTDLDPQSQTMLHTLSGTYDTTGASVDPLVGGMPASLPYAGYVPPVVSTVLLFVGAAALLAAGVTYFQRTDVD